MISKCLLTILVVYCAFFFGMTMASDLNGFKYKLEHINNQIECSVMRNSEVVQRILFGESFGTDITYTTIDSGTIISGNGLTLTIQVVLDSTNFTMMHISRTVAETVTLTDCIRLESNQMNWYGGPQQKYQYWPIEKLSFTDYSYVTKEADNCGIAERYWLNSRGSFIYVEPQVPLFITQNAGDNRMCLVAKRQLPYDTHTAGSFTFAYYIGMGNNPQDTHMMAIDQFLGKPTGHPAESMVKYPIWSTWARYSRDINTTVVTTLANEIIANGFTNGQFEIDDDWEICYGALTFRTSKFADIKALTTSLKALGFKVTLWVHPFINKVCEPYYTEALTNGYLVLDQNGNPETEWWNSGTGEAAYIDFTKPAAAKWFSDRLTALLNSSGIDSYKFDAGESSWLPTDPVLQGNSTAHPHTITSDYIRTVATFGELVEVRSGFQTQDLPVFVRMIDKDSKWTWNNGLPTLVTTLLQLNMNGYPLVLPDMIGGNGYDNSPPNKEMFIRWLQANVFMPSLQFSFLPWDYDAATITLALQFCTLHAQYSDLIMDRFALAVSTGEPVNPPLWWVAPTDRTAHRINDQFLLGDSIIAAPVLLEGHTTRDIYLPAGNWTDGNAATVTYVGPRWLMDYAAPLETLPYFIRVV